MFYYYGAKSKFAPRYAPPAHRTVIEPFAGAAGYSVHHLVEGNIDQAILVEKDYRVFFLWNRLLAMTPEEVLDMREPEAGEYTDDFFWMTCAASNALAKTDGFTFSARAATKTGSLKRRVARLLPYVKDRVTLIYGDYTDAPDVEATWFIDPPYQVMSGMHDKSRGNGYARGCDARSMDYSELAEWCLERRGQVTICEAEGADWLPFTRLFVPHNTLGQRLGYEVVWGNEALVVEEQEVAEIAV